jgi:tetratricopeptide (TPR) repeat protein
MARVLSRVPVTYENFSMMRELATRLCWDKQLDRGFTQLEHAGYLLSALNVADMGGEMNYLGEAADITDDMSCLAQLMGRNGDACKYQNLRLQTLTSQERPLECFVDPKHLDPEGDEILVLRDAYSAMAAFCIENGAQLQREGQPALALGCFESTHDFLRHCSLFSQTHVQVRNVRRNLASVLRDLSRTQEADQYDALMFLSNSMEENAVESRPYTNFKKIFMRKTPGGVPELYLPSGGHIGGSEQNKFEIKKLAATLLRLQNDAEEEEKKRNSKKASKISKVKVKDVRGIPATYSNFVMLRDLAKKLCWEKQFMKAFHQLEHAVHVLQVINVQHDSTDMIYGDKAADVLDDMACIMQLSFNYQKAYMYLMIRLQTLTGLQDPLLEDFVATDDDNMVLSDTHSAMYTILNLQAEMLRSEGKLADALEAFESALQMLHRCLLIADNHVQIANTRRNIASVLRALNRGPEADIYETQSVTVNFNIAALNGTYTEKDKIFFRPKHGGAPELYLPECTGTDPSSDQNRQDIQGIVKNVLGMRVDEEAGPAMMNKSEHAFQCLQSLAAMEYIRKKEDSEKAMQELLEEEEEDKKKAAAQASKKSKKKTTKAKEAKESKPDVDEKLSPEQQKMAGFCLAAMKLMSKNMDSEKAMQELLKEEEEDKKRVAEKASNKTKKNALKAKQAREKKQEEERVVEELFQEQQNNAGAKTFSEELFQEQQSNAGAKIFLNSGPLSALSSSPVCISPPVSLSSPVSKESEMDAYLEHFMCPISLEIMEDPVMTVDGSSYERASIEAWFQKTDRDPLTNEIVTSKALIPNKTLKSAIQAARELQRVLERV